MKLISTKAELTIPEGVTVTVKARKVDVKGPRGTLSMDFRHAAVDMHIADGKLKVEKCFAKSKERAVIRTIVSHVGNLITGVTKGFAYRMRLVYQHFPINFTVSDNEETVEIRNFLGEKRVRIIKLLPGVKAKKSEDVKDQIELYGSDIKNVSRSCALISQQCMVKGGKDIRKFLDGIYVSQWGILGELEGN